jgi:hypothetical protein
MEMQRMNRKLRTVFLLVAACLVLVWCIPSVGQVLKGSISGTVMDPQGAVVSGAQVKATNIATGVTSTTTSDSAGLFRFNLVPVGEYKVEVTAQGFKTSVQNNIVVSAGRDSGVGGVKLAVGETSTTIEVSAAAPLVETTQAQVTNTFSGTALATFAGIQENQGLDTLAIFVPGVVSTRDNSFSNSNGGGGFSSNGLRGRNNDQQIDGQNNNDNSVGGPGLFVSDTEFVQQYVLITNNFGPEYGRNAGAVVNIITKTGSNAWHGSVFGTENNSVLNSLNTSDKDPRICGDTCLTKPNQRNDEFAGGTLGGPIVKNKVFAFGGYDQERLNRNGTFTSAGVAPTPDGLAALAGCFPSGISNQAVQAAAAFSAFGNTNGNPQFASAPSNLTDPTDPTSALIVPGCPGATFAQVSRTVPQPFRAVDWILRSDVQLGSDTITGRYLYNRGSFFNLGDNAPAGYFFNEPALSQVALLSWTRNLSSRSVNELRVGFGRLNVEFGGDNFGSTLEPIAGSILEAPANVSFNSSATNLGFGPATNLPQQRIVDTWQAQDNYNYVLGRHQLKAGVNWTYQRSPNIFLPNVNGQFRFSSWNSFFANTPNRVTVANGPSSLDFREYDTFAYGGDDWKISNSLTLNLGLTWSYYGQPANIFNSITTARESNPATAFWDPSLPLSIRTLPTIPAPKNSFGPSLGFAWNPQWGGWLTGNGKTTIRGGYRWLYDPPYYNIYLNIATSAPESFLQTVTGAAANPLALPAVPTGPNVRASLASSLALGVFDPRSFNETTIAPNFGPDKVQSWSLGFEREVGKNSALEVRYAGNHGYNLFQTINENPFIGDLAASFPNLVPAGLTPCSAADAQVPTAVGRAHCDQGVVRQRTNTGVSNYSAAQVEFRSNDLFKQLTLRSSYTFSKTLDNVSEIFATQGAGNTTFLAQNPANPFGPGEYSLSGLDFPHQWSLIASEQLPFFKEQHGAIGHVLGGWTISANYVVASGQRYTPAQVLEASLFPQLGAGPDFWDFKFANAFAGFESARPFFGSASAPSSSVGIFCGDAANLNGILLSADCGGAAPATQLVSLNALNNDGSVVPVNQNQVRYILNADTAQQVFGTPFGNVPRNPVGAQDAISNIGNFSLFKDVKVSERVRLQFHATMDNAFNHSNFTSIDPFVIDAGLAGSFTGFGDPSLTTSTPRQIFFGGKISF